MCAKKSAVYLVFTCKDRIRYSREGARSSNIKYHKLSMIFVLIFSPVHAERARRDRVERLPLPLWEGERRALALAEVVRISKGEIRLPVVVELWSFRSLRLIYSFVLVRAEDFLRVGEAIHLLLPRRAVEFSMYWLA